MSIAEKLQTIAENEQRVYEAGKVAEHNAFWDSYLEKSYRGSFAFAGWGWDDESFDPPYGTVLQPTSARYMFAQSRITDLVALCEEKGVTLDFSKTDTTAYLFLQSYITRVGVVDVRKPSSISEAFMEATKLHTIGKLIIKDDGSQRFSKAFASASSLENIEIEGVIGQNGFDVSACTKLTHDSLMSIINALKDGVSGLTVTLGSTNLTKLTDAEKAIATQKGWTLA